MSSDRDRRLQHVRDAMQRILSDGRGRKPKELLGLLLQDKYCGTNYTSDALFDSIGAVVKRYDQDFYRDPSTSQILLSRRNIWWERHIKAIQTVAAGASTGVAKTAEAMEAREACSDVRA